MPLKEYTEVTVVLPIHTTVMGVTYRHEIGETIKLPPEVARFFEEKGLVSY